MKLTTIRRSFRAAAMMSLLAPLAGGCGTGPFNVEVFLDQADAGLRDKIGAVRSIEVNLVGVNEIEYQRWQQMSMNAYWEPDNPIRASAKKIVMTFGQGHDSKQTLKKNDPIWNVWLKQRKAKYLFVLAYMPWITADQPGQADPRRIILPLDIKRWDMYLWGSETIPIQLGAGGITALRQPKKQQ
ncbi:MAG: hypothetical protein J7M21_00810 [Planctomycetes bacterium]|nr:hypothetical protein [Planctomycetota bacterium]